MIMTTDRTSIQRKLLQLVLLISCVVLLLTSAGFFAYEFYTYREASKERLSTIGEVIAANSTGALAFQSPDDAVDILQALRAEKHIVAAAIYNSKGNLFAKYPDTIPNYNLPL